MTYWRVVARSEENVSVYLRESRPSFVIGRCTIRVEDGRLSLIDNVKAENKLEAEQAAMEMFEQVATALVLREGRPWRFQMIAPVEIPKSQTGEAVLVEATRGKVYSFHGTELVSPSYDPSIVQKLLQMVDPSETCRWLEAITNANQRTKRLVQYFKRGIALWETLPEEALLCFVKVVESFMDEYRPKFETKLSARRTDAFKEEIYEVTLRHFPQTDEDERRRVYSHILSLRFYTNKELLADLCRESGYVDTVLKNTETSLKQLVEMVYPYLSAEERAAQFGEIFAGHVTHVKTQTPKLWEDRPKVAHFKDESEIVHSSGTDSFRLARYLITKELGLLPLIS